MDYEFKIFFTWVLIVRISAFSLEVPIADGVNRANQNFTGEEFAKAGEPRTVPFFSQNHRIHLETKRGREKSIDTASLKAGNGTSLRKEHLTEHHLCLTSFTSNPGHSLNWKKFEKTPGCVDGFAACVEKNRFRHCRKRKFSRRMFRKWPTGRGSAVYTSEKISEMRKINRSENEKTNNPKHSSRKGSRQSSNAFESNIYSRRNVKSMKERRYKYEYEYEYEYGSLKKRLKYKGGKEEKVRWKGRQRFRFRSRRRRKFHEVRNEKSIRGYATISLPRSVLHNAKSNSVKTDESYRIIECQKNVNKICAEDSSVAQTNEAHLQKRNDRKNGSVAARKENSGDEHLRDLRKSSNKSWPHFVYHRVSSDVADPQRKYQNHRPSAYLAISVADSSNSVSGTEKKQVEKGKNPRKQR